MKVRFGFVSNSSSSSFIVATKDRNTKMKISVEVDLAELADKVCDSIDELNEYVLQEWGWRHKNIEEFLKDEDNQWVAENYRKAKMAIENGKMVLFGSFSSDGGPVESMLCESGLKGMVNDNVEIIYSEGGY